MKIKVDYVPPRAKEYGGYVGKDGRIVDYTTIPIEGYFVAIAYDDYGNQLATSKRPTEAAAIAAVKAVAVNCDGDE